MNSILAINQFLSGWCALASFSYAHCSKFHCK